MPRTLALPYHADAGSVARGFVRGWAADFNGHGSVDDLCLVANELVTNAFMHGEAPLGVTLSRSEGEVTIEVADGDPNLEDVQMRTPDESRSGGRGLLVVESLAQKWGVRSAGSGKIVWATVALHAPE